MKNLEDADKSHWTRLQVGKAHLMQLYSVKGASGVSTSQHSSDSIEAPLSSIRVSDASGEGSSCLHEASAVTEHGLKLDGETAFECSLSTC